jgi:hypothetical protein
LHHFFSLQIIVRNHYWIDNSQIQHDNRNSRAARVAILRYAEARILLQNPRPRTRHPFHEKFMITRFAKLVSDSESTNPLNEWRPLIGEWLPPVSVLEVKRIFTPDNEGAGEKVCDVRYFVLSGRSM